MDDFSDFKAAMGDVTPLAVEKRIDINKNKQDSTPSRLVARPQLPKSNKTKII